MLPTENDERAALDERDGREVEQLKGQRLHSHVQHPQMPAHLHHEHVVAARERRVLQSDLPAVHLPLAETPDFSDGPVGRQSDAVGSRLNDAVDDVRLLVVEIDRHKVGGCKFFRE